MSLELKLLSFICLGILAVKLIVKLIHYWYRLQDLNQEKRYPDSIPRSGAGVVFNKKTGKLENSPGNPILPF